MKMAPWSSSSSSSSCCCGCCSLRSFAIVAALVALLVAVVNPILNHLIDPIDTEAIKVQEEALENLPPFDPEVTDVMKYGGLAFTKQGHQLDSYIGLTFILAQSFPRWVVKLAEKYDPYEFDTTASEVKEVDILDARKAPEIRSSTFAERGFTLLNMSDDPSIQSVQNWRSQEEIKKFQKELEPRLLELIPGATRIEFTYSVVRGGSMFGDQPAAIGSPHLDYSQNDTAREEFHETHPVFFGAVEQSLLLGQGNTDDEEMSMMIGIWKPVMMENPVCDHPLAVMDARTFSQDQESSHAIHINFGFFTFYNLNGAVHHHEDQKWYYYPFQEESEVLIFTQYSKGRHFANPHGSFVNPNCPKDYDSRVSVEMRAAVFFKKE